MIRGLILQEDINMHVPNKRASQYINRQVSNYGWRMTFSGIERTSRYKITKDKDDMNSTVKLDLADIHRTLYPVMASLFYTIAYDFAVAWFLKVVYTKT